MVSCDQHNFFILDCDMIMSIVLSACCGQNLFSFVLFSCMVVLETQLPAFIISKLINDVQLHFVDGVFFIRRQLNFCFFCQSFTKSLFQVWKKLQGIGNDLISLAKSLSDVSLTCCNEQVRYSTCRYSCLTIFFFFFFWVLWG